MRTKLKAIANAAMYERRLGSKYSGQRPTTAQLRQDLAVAFPGIKSTVRWHHNRAEATIYGIPDELHGTDAGRKVLTAAQTALEAYNHDGSDIQSDYFDVLYYTHVSFETAADRAEKEAQRLISKQPAATRQKVRRVYNSGWRLGAEERLEAVRSEILALSIELI